MISPVQLNCIRLHPSLRERVKTCARGISRDVLVRFPLFQDDWVFQPRNRKHAILYAMQFSIFARSLGLIAAEHPVKVAGITKAAAIRNLRDRVFGGA